MPANSPPQKFTLSNIRRIVLENPMITVDELLEAAWKHGQRYKRSSVIIARQQALEMIKAAKELGHWKD